MPKSVKVFVGLGVLYVLFGAAISAWTLFHPLPIEVHLYAKLPAHVRDEIRHAALLGSLETFAIHTAVFAILAGLAALARQSWARWLLALYFLLVLVMPFVLAYRLYLTHPGAFPAASGGFAGWLKDYLDWHWLRPSLCWPVYIGTALKLALLVLIFSPNARPWFRAPAPE